MSSPFRDILSEFTDARVEYLLVGAYALAAHGLIRGTGDIDLWIHATPENAKRVEQAMLRFGAPRELFNVDDFAQPSMVVQVGVPPYRIDILTDLTGVEWEQAWEDRFVSTFEGVEVPVLSRAHVIANKRATNRPKDQLDLAWLEQGPSSE